MELMNRQAWARWSSDEAVGKAQKAVVRQYQRQADHHMEEAMTLDEGGQARFAAKARWFGMALRDYASAEERPAKPLDLPW